MANKMSATVTSISGRAFARSAGGELRELRPGDVLQEGETLVTPDGAKVELSLSDGSALSVSDVPEMAISRDLVAETAAGADESAVEDETVQQVLTALESGEDIGDALQAPAAGAEEGSGPEKQGHSWIRLSRIIETTSEFAGIAGSDAAESAVVVDDNVVPVDAIDDAATTDEGVPVVINVQNNDQFLNGAIVTGVTNGAHGTVVINTDNTVTYTPNAGFFGTDTFTYTATSIDGIGQDTAVVTVVIQGEPVIPPPPPTISIGDDIVVEGETATLTLALSKPSTETITVQYSSADGTAVAPGDYDPVTGLVTVTFAPGETSKTITVSTNVDNLEEGTEHFNINLTSPTNATIADGTGVVTIQDNFVEPPPPPPPTPGRLSVAPGKSVVDEENLPGGSNEDPVGLSKTGSFSITAEDGLKSLAVTADSGTVNVVVNGVFVPGTSVIEEGVVRITFDSMSGPDARGNYTINVTATLLGEFQHTGANDDQVALNFTIRIADVNGDTAISTRTAIVIDDTPTAVNDGPVGVVEDGASNISGNVLTNDSAGADAPGAFDVWAAGNAANIAALNTYGTLTLNANGSWSYVLDNSRAATQALSAASNLSYNLNYTMKDADGDTSPATLTITITGANDGSSVVTAAASGPDAQVLEHGLVVAAPTETVTGSFTVTTTDGIQNLVIGGTVFTLAQVQAFATTNGTVNTGEGVLTLTGYTGNGFGGTVNYSYTLSATIDNDSKVPGGNDTVDATGFNDSVLLTVNGIGGTTGSDNLVIRAVDDTPTAVNDGPVGVVEDGASNISGNVLTNDSAGADAPGAFDVWAAGNAANIAALNTYGTLTLNANGSWSYVLDNSRAATQALSAASNLSYNLNYTMKDADGDTSPATLTITITGANDGSSVVTAAASGPDAQVLEHGLVVAAPTETVTGSFTVTTTDGIQNLVIGGTVFTLAQVQAFATTNGTVNTGEGVLTLTGYTGNGFGGTVNYSYTLSATIDNDSKVPSGNDTVDATGFNDSVLLTVNGIGGTTGSDNLVIRAVDDTPTAVNDGPVGVVEDGASNISGNVLSNDSAGADAPGAFDVWAAGNAANIAALNTYGTLTLNANGSWSYVLDNSRAATQALSAASNLSYNLNYTMKDADGDTSPATLTITITGANDGSSVVTAAASGPDAQVLEHGLVVAAPTETVTGSFTVTTTDGIQNLVIGGTVFTLAQVQAFATTNGTVNTGEGVLTLTGYTGNGFGGTVNYSYTLSATIDNDSKVPSGNDTVDATGFNDSVLLTVNGIGGTTGSDNLVIRAVDDTPTAVNDGPVGVVEDGASNISGNVLTNDSAGADAPGAFDVWAAGNAANIAALNTYGTLTLNANGSWSYVLDNSRAATQALSAASNLSYNLNYTMKDADGDTSPATLTITITGANDGSSVVTAAASGPDAQVLEHGLVVAAPTETVTGSFTVTTTDGIQNLVIGGTVFTLAQVQAFATTNGTVNTGEGVLTLTGYTGNGFGGTVNYSYTLSATIDNDSKVPGGNDTVDATGFNDSVLLTVNGIGGTTGSDNLVIRAVDDTPTAVNDGPVGVVEDGASNISGNVLTNDSAGADAPGAFDVWAAGNAANIAALNTYGTLTLNANGSWSYVLDNSRAATQALSAASNLSYNLNYTMKDADGDTSPATLTITITGANDGSSVVTAAASGPDAQVLEHGLVVAAPTETVTGSFTVTTTDGIQNLVIGGTVFTLAQVQAFATTNGTVNTGEGVLTLTGYTGNGFGGTVNYSYTLSATIDNDSKVPGGNDTVDATGFNDSVLLTVNGIGGTTGSDNLVIRAVDDTPTAVNDGPVGVVEDGASNISGNVLTNDSAGADAPGAFDVWAAGNAANIAALNTYGTLTLNANGSWSYVLDNSRAATQALSAASNLSYNLNYTMKDADGDTSPATLTITITGANDGSSVVTAAASGPDAQVLEHGLVVAAPTETVTGSFTVTTTDGIQNLVIGGTVFTLAQVQAFATTNGTVNTGEGVLTLTGYTGNGFGGTVNYSYTLSATIDNDSKVPGGNDTVDATGFNDSVLLTVNGIGGTTGSDNLVIRAVDDTPTAVNDGPVGVVEDGASNISGNVLTNDSAGADAPGAFDVWAAGNAANIAALNTYGTLTLNANGSWSYVLDNSRAATQALSAASNLSYNLNYTMKDADGDTSPATLTITITGANDGSSVVTAAASGPDAQVLEHGLVVAAPTETVTGSFTVTTTDGIQNLVIGGTVFTLAQVQAFATTNGTVNTGEGVLTLTGYTGNGFGGTVNYSYTLSATIDNDSKVPGGNDTVDATGFNDSVLLTVNGIGGTTGSDNLVIRAVDDTPTAVNDGPVGVVEDGASNISGNVLTNDSAGADAPGAFDVWAAGNAANIAALNTYGTLTLNANGSWSYVLDNSRAATQALSAASNLSYNLNYTMKDADGDTSPATLTITITGANDGSSVVTAAASGPDAQVLEHGLVVAAPTETVTGSFTVTTTDGIQNLVIGGTVFTLAQVQAFATTNGTVNTGEGVLTLTGYTGNGFGGTVNYSYTLSATIDNDSKVPGGNDTVDATGFNDSVLLTVNGIGGTTGSDNLVIRAVDDTPTAVNDGPVGVVEDGASNISGNVLSNDSAGADAPGAFDVWAAGNAANIAALNTYGTLTLNANGSWSYVLDNSRAATQALSAASNLSYNLNYTMKDADGDTSPATLTITITGANDGSSVVTAAASGPDAQVLEHGLVVAAPTETVTGSFTVTTTDGIQNLVIGGTVFTLAQVQAFATTNGTVNTGEGVLTLTGYTGNGFGGTVNYSYTLSATIDNDSKVPGGNDTVDATGFNDSVLLTVNGIGGTTGSDNLVIRAVDDTPTIGNFVDFTVPNAIGVTAGTTNTGFDSGADKWGAINITGEAITGLTYLPLVVSKDANGNVVSVTLTAEETNGGDDVFSYTVMANGQHSFNLLKPEAESTIIQTLSNLSAGGPTPFLELPDYTIEFSGSGSGVNSSTQGMGIDNQFIDSGEILRMEFYNPGRPGDDVPDNTSGPANATERMVNSLVFTDTGAGGTFNWIVYNSVDGTSQAGTSVVTNSHLTIDAGIEFNRVEITGGADAKARLTEVQIGERILPDGETITFNVTGTDRDGDATSTDNITVTVLPGADADTLMAADTFARQFSMHDSVPEATIHTSTLAAESLLSTDGADVFVWSLADNTAQGDLVIGFNPEADAIDIADLLGDSVNTTDFSSYLDVSLEGTSTVLRISNTADFDHAEQVITVQDVNLFEGIDFNDSAALHSALQNMVDAGRLVTD